MLYVVKCSTKRLEGIIAQAGRLDFLLEVPYIVGKNGFGIENRRGECQKGILKAYLY